MNPVSSPNTLDITPTKLGSEFSESLNSSRRPSGDTAFNFASNLIPLGRLDDTDSMQSSTESTTLTNSFISHTRENVVSMIASLQERSAIYGWKAFTFYLAYYILTFWSQLFLPTIRDHNWGSEGSYVFIVLNFPSTLLFNMVPYFGAVGLSGFFMLVVFLTTIQFGLAYYYTINPNKYFKYVKISLWYSSWFIKITYLIGAHLLVGFLDCNISKQISIPVTTVSGSKIVNYNSLYRYNSIGCLELDNEVMIALSAITLLILLLIYPLTEFVTSNCNPQSKVIFTAESSVLFSILGMVNIIGLIIELVIPIQYSYIPSIIHLLLTFICCIIIFRSLPFFTHYENSIVQGIYVGRFGVSVGALISSIVNSSNNSEIGGGLVGLTVSLALLGFICGLVLQLFIIWYRVKSIRDSIITSSTNNNNTEERVFAYIEKMAPLVYSELEELKKLGYLNLFLKLSLKRKSDTVIAFWFVKGLAQNKSFRNVSSLIYSSMLVQIFWTEEQNASALANSLLRKALKNEPSFMDTIKIQEHINEVEANSLSKNGLYEISSQIQKIEQCQSNLLALHKDFWKELANEHINYESIKKTNRSIHCLTSECKAMLNNLLFNYKHNKTVLRAQAYFIENFEFNKPLADAIYAEANSLEEEEMKRKRRPSQSKAKKNNRIVPNDKLEITSAFYEESSIVDQVEQDKLEEELEDAFENPQLKKELLFLNAISTPKSNGLVKTVSFTYFLFAIICIVSSIILSVLYSYSVKSTVPYVEHVCFTGTIPYSIIKNIRACQNWMNTFQFQEVEFPILTEGYPSITKTGYINDHKIRLIETLESLKNLVSIGQEGVFTENVYADYSSSVYAINFPTEDLNNPQYYTGKYETRNASIVEITNSLIKYTGLLIEDYPQSLLLKLENRSLSYTERQKLLDEASQNDYFNPLTNFNFNYLWSNKGVFTSAYESFCTKYLDSSIVVINNSVQQYMIYTIIIMVAYILLSLIFIVFVIMELDGIKKLVKLFDSQIKKDIVGKIFHDISKKLHNGAIGNVSTTSIDQLKPNMIILVCIILVSITTCTIIGMLFYESFINGADSINIMTRVRLSIQAAVNVEKASFSAQEFYTYFGADQFTSPNASLRYLLKRTVSYGDMKLWPDRSRFDSLNSRVTDGIAAASNYMSKLIYGSTELSLDPLLGQYPIVDRIISVGVDNCTEYMRVNNITFIYATFKLYCQGLETVFSDFATTAPQLVVDSRKQYALQGIAIANKTLLDPFPLAMRNNLLLRLSQPLISKYKNFIQEFVQASSSPNLTISISTCSIGLSIILLTIFCFHHMISNFWNHFHSFRLMLNYVPIDFLDHNDRLREFSLYHTIGMRYTNHFLKSKKINDYVEDEYYNLKVVFNSSVEGTMICTENGEIELFNSSGLRMFGSKSIDILGTSMFELFDVNFRAQVKKAVTTLVLQLKEQKYDSEKQNVEIMELDMLRRNQTKFPAKVTIYSIRLGGKDVKILITFKDVTPEKKQHTLLGDEKKKSDNLLKNILPTQVANRLKTGETFIAEKFDDITCFFSDMVGFTKISSKMQPTDLVKMLNSIVNGFDVLTEKYELEKIKTIGDAYFLVGGLHNSQSDHPERVLKFAMDTFGVVHQYNRNKVVETDDINIRVGINTGPVVAGVIGSKKFAYDLWGDAINVASRMESTGVPGTIQISRSTYERVFDLGFEFEEREIDVKGKGSVKTYLMNSKHLRDLNVTNILTTQQSLQDVMKSQQSLFALSSVIH